MHSMRIMGVDASTYVGMGLLVGERHETKLIHFPKERGFKRISLIRKAFFNMVEEWKPDKVIIEGYAYGNANTLVTLVEIGTSIRNVLYDLGVQWVDVPPTALKKYVTGSGVAKKEDMAKAAFERWGYESKSDDVIDALCLAQFGRELYIERNADLESVLSGKSKKRRKK